MPKPATTTQPASTALAPVAAADDGLAAITELANRVAPSALLPEALRGKPGDVLIVLLTGRELGLQPMQSLRCIQVIKGRAQLSAELKVALCKKAPECEYFRLVESSSTKATWETKRKDNPTPTRLSFTIEQAREAELLKEGGNWIKYPAAMLRWRAGGALADAEYPERVLAIGPDEGEGPPARGEAPAVLDGQVVDLGTVDAGDLLVAVREDLEAVSTHAELEALVPRLRELPAGPSREEARRLYREAHERLDAAARAAAAAASTNGAAFGGW